MPFFILPSCARLLAEYARKELFMPYQFFIVLFGLLGLICWLRQWGPPERSPYRVDPLTPEEEFAATVTQANTIRSFWNYIYGLCVVAGAFWWWFGFLAASAISFFVGFVVVLSLLSRIMNLFARHHMRLGR